MKKDSSKKLIKSKFKKINSYLKHLKMNKLKKLKEINNYKVLQILKKKKT